MTQNYTHIYDITHGDDSKAVINGYEHPLAVAIGTRETILGTPYTPDGPRSCDNKWPGAEYPVIEYDTLAEYRMATAHLETVLESAHGVVEGDKALTIIHELDCLMRA